jgi:hypothetical protein
MSLDIIHQMHAGDPLIVIAGALMLLTGILRAGRRGDG